MVYGGAFPVQITAKSTPRCSVELPGSDAKLTLLNDCKEKPCYTEEFVIGRLLRQIAADFTIIQRAYHIRLMGTENERIALAQADILANQALKLAKNSDLINDDTTVLTYFNKTALVRVIPYAPVALIGIPVTCVGWKDNFSNFMAIPHEIGHYVYWHAREKLKGDSKADKKAILEVTKNGWIKPGKDNRLSSKIFSTIQNYTKTLPGQEYPSLQDQLGSLEEIFRSDEIDNPIENLNNDIVERLELDFNNNLVDLMFYIEDLLYEKGIDVSLRAYLRDEDPPDLA